MTRCGVNNVVANLGTALTDKQILILNQFFDHIIIFLMEILVEEKQP